MAFQIPALDIHKKGAAASINRCGYLLIDAAASINRCGHLFIDAAASIYRWPHLFIDAAIYKIDFLKFNLLSNGLIEKFWDALWLGIGPFLCLTEETLDRAGTDAPHHQPRVGQDCANMMSQFRRFFPPHHTCVGSMCHIIAIFLSSSSEILLSTVV